MKILWTFFIDFLLFCMTLFLVFWNGYTMIKWGYPMKLRFIAFKANQLSLAEYFSSSSIIHTQSHIKGGGRKA